MILPHLSISTCTNANHRAIKEMIDDKASNLLSGIEGRPTELANFLFFLDARPPTRKIRLQFYGDLKHAKLVRERQPSLQR